MGDQNHHVEHSGCPKSSLVTIKKESPLDSEQIRDPVTAVFQIDLWWLLEEGKSVLKLNPDNIDV
jgi:hypothetical protein